MAFRWWGRSVSFSISASLAFHFLFSVWVSLLFFFAVSLLFSSGKEQRLPQMPLEQKTSATA